MELITGLQRGFREKTLMKQLTATGEQHGSVVTEDSCYKQLCKGEEPASSPMGKKVLNWAHLEFLRETVCCEARRGKGNESAPTGAFWVSDGDWWEPRDSLAWPALFMEAWSGPCLTSGHSFKRALVNLWGL